MTPVEVKLHQVSSVLELIYEDGTNFDLPAEYLRVFSPSAEVQGHSLDEAVLQHGKMMVKIANLKPQGHYAIRIEFSDGHNSGVFPGNTSINSVRTRLLSGLNISKNWKRLVSLESPSLLRLDDETWRLAQRRVQA